MLTFAPDALSTAPEVLTAVSAVPTMRGYASPPVAVNAGLAALAAAPQGAALVIKSDSTRRTFAGTVDAIYEVSAGAWSDVSRVGGYTAATTRWAFGIVGNLSLAINKVTVLQSSTTGDFADVANTPMASTMCVAQGYVILGNCDDTGVAGLATTYGDQPDRIWISPFQDPTGDWDIQDNGGDGVTLRIVETEGAITRVERLNADVVAYKAKSLYLGRFTDDVDVLRFQCVASDVGCPARDAVVAAGSVHYFMGDDDIYAFDGSRPQPISGLLREWLFGSDTVTGRVNLAQISTVQAIHDRRSKLIYWCYASTGSDVLDEVVVYHYASQRWGSFEMTVKDVLQAVTDELTIDDLDSLYATIDAMSSAPPVDSPYWTSSLPVLAFFDASNVLQSFSGTGGPMTCTTGFFGSEDTVSLCDRVRPRFRVKPTTCSIAGHTTMALGDATTAAASGDINGDRFDVLQSARWHKFALTFNSQTELEAITPRLQPEGEE